MASSSRPDEPAPPRNVERDQKYDRDHQSSLASEPAPPRNLQRTQNYDRDRQGSLASEPTISADTPREREPLSRKHRYFKMDATTRRREPHKQLVASLTRLVTNSPPASVPPGGGLYYGPVSIGYLFFVLQRIYPELMIEDKSLGSWAVLYLARAKEHMMDYPGPEKNKCGISDDIMALLAIDAASTRDESVVRDLCDWADVVTDPEACNEWLYGRAGYLYLLRFVKVCFADDPKVKQMIDSTADEVIDEIVESQRPWKWHGKAYVGAVHGAIGIITQIVLTDVSWAPKLEAELATLLTYQYDSGNYPASIPPGKDRLVQVCHGAPGVVISLLSIRDSFPKLKDRIDRTIAKARQDIMDRGLLTKEPCLCHGISGNALALDGEDFEKFLSYTTHGEMKALERDGVMERADDPSGLWTGEAGRAWAWAIADSELEKTLLGYNDV